MNNLEKSIQIALRVHSGQVDLGGHPYILHPLRVLAGVEARTRKIKNWEEREVLLCAAVLHDVLEDCLPVRRACLRKNIGYIHPRVLAAVEDLTRGEDETWKHYIDRVKLGDVARTIKIVDLEENIDLTRLESVSEIDLRRNRMYEETLWKMRNKV